MAVVLNYVLFQVLDLKVIHVYLHVCHGNHFMESTNRLKAVLENECPLWVLNAT